MNARIATHPYQAALDAAYRRGIDDMQARIIELLQEHGAADWLVARVVEMEYPESDE